MKTQKATRKQTKFHNQRLILKTIYIYDRISRADVARATHLTRPTVSGAVAELIEEGLVEEVGQGQSEGGKPPILLSVADDARHLIGIDLAEGEFRGGIVDLRGRVVAHASLPVEDLNGSLALEQVYALLDTLVAATSRPLLGIGIGAPGLIDARHGLVRYAVNLDWQNLALRDLLTTRYALPVYVANDCHVAALGEYTFGLHPITSNLIVIKVGRGIAAGIVLNGHLYYGDGSGAGEIGHVRVVEEGIQCQCGHIGCLETVASARAIVKQAQLLVQEDTHSALHSLAATVDAINLNTVYHAWQAGDAAVQALVETAGRHLGRAVANLIGALNIHQIVLAGDLTCFGDALLIPIREEMQLRAMEPLAAKTQINLSQLAGDIVIQGAAALLLANELGLV
ncbi:MAG: ROK family transcriptional regulator [Anaerolineae bacterium]|nr:ROK family transcriptional regulator [Anaerolineae bacterium]